MAIFNVASLLTKVNGNRLATLLFVLACVSLATPASALQCIPREQFTKPLEDRYGEAQRLVGTADPYIIEFWANADTGTWSLFITRPDGLSCAIGSGEGWELLPAKPKGEGT